MPEHTPCANCHARCCQEHIVPLCGFDMWRIARGLEFEPEQFVKVRPQPETNSHGFILDHSGRTYYMSLGKRPAGPEAEECIFWLRMEHTGRCGIYELRPQVCRTYPSIMRGLDVERREDVLCPVDAWRDGILQKPSWRHSLFSVTVEFDIYRMAVGRWNRHVLNSPEDVHFTEHDYMQYVLAFYDQLADVRNAFDAEEWRQLCDWWGVKRTEGVGPLVDRSIDAGQWEPMIDRVHVVTGSFFAEELAARK
jgi:Fe-S-cluster containining protein